MQEYQVQYHIEVFSSPAIEAINKFKTALTSLSGAGKHLTELQRQVKSVNDTLAGLRKQQLQLNTAHAKEQLNELLVMARELKATLAGTTMGASTRWSWQSYYNIWTTDYGSNGCWLCRQNWTFPTHASWDAQNVYGCTR